jgi:phage-related protein
MPPGLQNADQRNAAVQAAPERATRPELDNRAPDKGMDGSVQSGPMTSSKAPYRPVQAKGAIDFAGASVFLKEVASGEQKPLGPPPKPKGLETQGATDGGMDSTDGGGDSDAPAPPPTSDAGGAPAAAAPPPPSGGGGGGADPGANAASSAEVVKKGRKSQGKGSDTSAAKVGKKVFSAGPSAMIADFKTIGSQLTAAKKQDEARGFAKMPTLKAVLPDDAQASAKKKAEQPKVDDKITDGVDEADARLPDKSSGAPQTAPKQKLAGGDAAKLAELEGVLEHLKSFFGGLVGGISTDSEIKTNPGAPPPVRLEGQSNPSRAPKQEASAGEKIEEGHAKAAKAIDDGPGPTDVHRQPMEEAIAPKQMPDIAVVEAKLDEGMSYYESMAITPQEREKADKLLAPAVKGKMAKVDADLDQTLDAQEMERDKAIEDAEKETEALNVEAQAEQEDMVAKAKKDIAKEQDKTRKAQKDEVKKAKKKGDKERRAVEKKVKARKTKDDKKVKGEFGKARKKAEGEKSKAHRKAKDEKKKAEEKKKKQSWWDRVKSAVSSVVNAVCKVIGGIFDVLGKLVGGIFDAVKSLASGIIDLACKFAKGLLDGLGKLMKGLITGLVGSVFPGLAKKLNGYIDKGLAAVKKGIDFVGDKLKAGVNAIADAANGVVQKGLQVAKTGLQTAVRVAGCIATGDFKGAFLEVLYGAAEMAGISRATVEKILGKAKGVLKNIVDKPVAFIKNLIKAGGGGIKKFVSGFIQFLKKAFIDWIVGPLAKGGLQIPKAFNVVGIFKMVGSMLGVTKDWIFGLVEKRLGPGARAVLDKVMEYVDAFMSGGIGGIWEQIKSDVGNLWEMMMSFVIDFVKSKVITMAAEKLASLLAGPIGALYQILKTAYSIYTTIRDKLDKIKTVLGGLFGSIGDIAKGALGGATSKIVGALVAALGVAIDLFAKIASIGGIPKKIRGWLSKVGKKVQKGIEKLVDKLISKVKGLFKGGKGRDAKGKDKDKKSSPKLPKPTPFTTKDGHKHKVWTENKGGKLNTRVASTPKDVDKQIAESKKDSKDAPKEVKGKIEQAVTMVESADKKIDDKPIDKADPKKIATDQKTLAQAVKKLLDAESEAAGPDSGPYPKTYAGYSKALTAHGTYKGKIGTLEKLGKDFVKGGGDAKRETQQLEIKADKVEELKAQYDKAVKELDEGKAAKLKGKLDDTKQAGKTMPELLELAKKHSAAIKKGGPFVKEAKDKLNSVMRASTLLASQIDPKGSKVGRKLYVEIDENYHPELLTAAKGAGAPKGDRSKLAVNYRNWLRSYFRLEVMGDGKHAEILFLRDAGVYGQATGLTWEQCVDKVVRDLKKVNKETGKAVLKDDFTLGAATPAELDKIYGGVIGSAEKTNVDVSANMGAIKESYKDSGDGKNHQLLIDDKGKVVRHSVKTLVPDIPGIDHAGDAMKATKVIEGLVKKYKADPAKNAKLLPDIKSWLAKLKVALSKDYSADVDLHKTRQEFEKNLGLYAMTHKYSLKVAKTMCTKSYALIESIVANTVSKTEQAAEKIEWISNKCGKKTDSGFAGAIGKDVKHIEKILKGGKANLRERILIGYNFQEKLAETLMDPAHGPKMVDKILKEAGVHEKQIQEVLKTKENFNPGDPDKGVYGDSPHKKTYAPPEEAKDFAAGKKKDPNTGLGMDEKFPAQPVETLDSKTLRVFARQNGIDASGTDDEIVALLKADGKHVTPKGEGHPQSRSTRKASDAGLKMSSKEKKAPDFNSPDINAGEHLPFIEGGKANLVDEGNFWIKEARKLSMPITAGVSGTTQRYMAFGAKIGLAPLNHLRLAMLGFLIPMNAHSFHEIMTAAAGHSGCDYKKGHYDPIKPLSTKKLQDFAGGKDQFDAMKAPKKAG